MNFVYPEFLWALTALAVPIIIHLFNFRKYKTLYFSSLQFIQHVEQRSKSTQKLKNLIVLLLRMLAFTSLIFAFAQPYFGVEKSENQLGKDVLAIHIDNSFSMTMKGAEGELLSEAKESARQLLSKAPLNARILLSTNSLDGIESRLTTKIDALDRLDKIEAGPMVRSFDEVINWQKKCLDNSFETSEIGKVQHIYLSDYQKNTTTFSTLKADKTSNYIPILFAAQSNSNLSIDSVWFSSPLHKIGMNNELNIKISNNSNEALQNVQLNFELGNKKRDLFVDIAENSSEIAVINYTDKETGWKNGKLSVQDKQFYADDDYFFTYHISKKSKLLIINGEQANTNVGNIYRLDDFYEVHEISEGQYTQDQLTGINLVVLNGLNDVPSGMNENLINFWKNGGTLSIFPGSKVNFASFNSFLSNLSLPNFSKQLAQNSRINTLNYKDPFFKGVFSKEKENLSLPAVSAFYLTNPSTNSRSLDIVQLQNGKPLFLRTDNEQQAFLFTSVLSPEFGSFTSDILFTTLLLRIGELSLRNPAIALTIGASENYPIYTKLNDDKPVHLIGNQLDFIPKTEKNSGVTYINLSGTEAINQLRSGIYTIQGETEIGKIALNYNRKESKIDQFSEEEINTQLKEMGIDHSTILEVSEGVSSTNLELKKAYPYWKFFVILTLVFLILEIIVIKFWNSKTTQKLN